jgi:hypothetical protein
MDVGCRMQICPAGHLHAQHWLSNEDCSGEPHVIGRVLPRSPCSSQAAVLALAKPPGEANLNYIQRVQVSFAPPPVSSSASLRSSSDTVNNTSDASLILETRILELEALLENAESEAARARLDLSAHLIRTQITTESSESLPLESSQVPSTSQSTKRGRKRKVPAECPESDSNATAFKKRKMELSPTAEPDIPLGTLLKHMAAC